MQALRFTLMLGLGLAICATPVPSFSQAVAGAQISGIVTDSQQALVPGAIITATQADTGAVHTVTSGPNGTYTLADLPVGTYTMTVVARGFGTSVEPNIELHVGNSVTINVAMTIGSSEQQIVVTTGSTSIETEQTSVSQVVDHQRMVDLPLNGRQATQFILLSGAAAVTPAGDLISNKNYPSSTNISIAGGQGNGTNYLMDGGDNNDPWSSVNLPFPFPDALDEFNVQFSSLPAKYGVHPGGVVNIVTKSGSNRFHGDLFEFVRNGDFNARNYFATARDTLHRNQFGGTIGGPIFRQKIFFFGGYQKTLTRTTPPQTTSFVPTAAVLAGNFSTYESAGCQTTGQAKTLIDPSTGKPLAGNVINPSRFNQQALNLLKDIPVVSNPCGQTVYGIPNPQDEDQYIGRVDWNISGKHTLFGRYFLANYVAPAPTLSTNFLLSTLGGVHDKSTSGVFGDTYSFSASLVNSAHFTYTTTTIARQTAPNLTDPGQLGIQIYTPVPDFLNLSITGRFSVGCGNCAPANFNRSSIQVVDDVDLIRGRHHFAWGGDWIHTVLDQNNVLNANGSITFNGQSTGDGLADFLLGLPSAFTQGNVSRGNYRQDYIGAYFQDTYKANQHLNLTAGLRWEPFMPAADTYNRGGYFNSANFASGTKSNVYLNAPAGLQFVGDPGIPRGYVNKRFGDFEPRVGIVFDPKGNGRGVIRAGYGVFFDFPELAFSTGFNSQAPWGNTISLTSPAGGLTNPYQGVAGGNPFPLPSPPTSTQAFPAQGTYVSLPLHFRPTSVQQFDLSFEQQIGENWSVSATYLGNVSRHIWGGISLNPSVYIPGTCSGSPCSSTKNTAARRVLSQQNPTLGNFYSSITGGYDGGSSSYNGLLLSAKRRFNNSYSIVANYTYSHCLSSVDFTGDIGATSPTVENPSNPGADYGNCGFDVRNNLNVSIVAATPTFKNRAAYLLVTGWELAPIIAVHSGLWFTPLTGTDNSLTAVGLDRPNVSGNRYTRNTVSGQWLNASAFTPNSLGTFGDAGRFSLEGPGYADVDLALIRKFKLWEFGDLQFRAEAFNAFNHTNFLNPAATLNVSTFGRILSSNDPRILQLAAKFTF